MASISFDAVTVDFPVYNSSARSLKKRLFQVATGGQLSADDKGRVVVRSLEGLTFDIVKGERVALLGHNGAGKSSLLRLLSGVYFPSTGVAKVEGTIGSLIDISLGIDHEATGRDNVYLRGALLGLSKATIEEKMDEIIDFSELGDFVDMPLRTYSSGMHLRLAFAVSTIIRPEILLMDEWLSVGDEGFKHKAEERLTSLVDATDILIIATHSKDMLLRVCTRAIWLDHGRIKMDADAKTVADAYFGP